MIVISTGIESVEDVVGRLQKCRDYEHAFPGMDAGFVDDGIDLPNERYQFPVVIDEHYIPIESLVHLKTRKELGHTSLIRCRVVIVPVEGLIPEGVSDLLSFYEEAVRTDTNVFARTRIEDSARPDLAKEDVFPIANSRVKPAIIAATAVYRRLTDSQASLADIETVDQNIARIRQSITRASIS